MKWRLAKIVLACHVVVWVALGVILAETFNWPEGQAEVVEDEAPVDWSDYLVVADSDWFAKSELTLVLVDVSHDSMRDGWSIRFVTDDGSITVRWPESERENFQRAVVDWAHEIHGWLVAHGVDATIEHEGGER